MPFISCRLYDAIPIMSCQPRCPQNAIATMPFSQCRLWFALSTRSHRYAMLIKPYPPSRLRHAITTVLSLSCRLHHINTTRRLFIQAVSMIYAVSHSLIMASTSYLRHQVISAVSTTSCHVQDVITFVLVSLRHLMSWRCNHHHRAISAMSNTPSGQNANVPLLWSSTVDTWT